MAAWTLTVAARASPLSQAQVREVERWWNNICGPVRLIPNCIETEGDRDLITSLRSLPPGDFFTREIDEAVLSGSCRIAIHSAKDLPPVLPEGLLEACRSPCLDARDALVLRPGLSSLPQNAVIATSSVRRDEVIRNLWPSVKIVDIRGTIHQRLQRLEQDCDGVVVAECALMRLGLTYLPRIHLPGPTAEGQGRLAVICRTEDEELLCYLAALSEKITL